MLILCKRVLLEHVCPTGFDSFILASRLAASSRLLCPCYSWVRAWPRQAVPELPLFFFCSLTTLWILTHRKCSGTRSAFRHKGTVPVKSQGSSGGFGRWINQVTTRAAATAARSEHRKCHATDLPPEQCGVEITSLEENKWTDTKRDFLWGCWIEKDLKPKHISMGGTPSTPPCARSRVAGSTDQSQHHGTASPAEPCN